MANENRISVVITADPTGAVTGIRMVGDETEKLSGRTQSLTQRLKSHWAEVSVGIYAAVKAFQSIWGLMEKAAQTDEAMASLDALTRQYGMTAQDLVGKIEQESKGSDRDGGRRQGCGGRSDEGPRARINLRRSPRGRCRCRTSGPAPYRLPMRSKCSPSRSPRAGSGA